MEIFPEYVDKSDYSGHRVYVRLWGKGRFYPRKLAPVKGL
jgi:hypothetical protein